MQSGCDIFFPSYCNIYLTAADNVLVYFKRNVNLFIHGRGQDIGLVANYFPVQPMVYPLSVNQIHKLDFQAGETINDEILGCNGNIDEGDYYRCAKNVIAKKLKMKPSPGCTVPMFSNIFMKRFEFFPMYNFIYHTCAIKCHSQISTALE